VSLQVRTPRREESGILLANIEGLFPQRACHKIGVLREMTDEGGIFMNALTESHLRKDILDAEFAMEGFQHYRADQTGGRKKGGCCTVELRSESGNSDGLVEHVLLHMKKLDLCVATVYRPSTCPSENFNKTLEEIEARVAGLGEPAPSLIMEGGDFNLPRIRWKRVGDVEVGDRDRSQEAKLVKFAEEHLLSHQVQLPTRERNILDLFFTGNERMLVDVRVEETSLSDH
jgi:hypothetical protein